MANELNFDENLKRLENAIKERRKRFCQEQMQMSTGQNNVAIGYDQYSTCVCGSIMCEVPKYVDAYNAMGQSCAKVSAAYMPNHERHDDWDKTRVEILRNENQKLTQNMQKLIMHDAQLIDEINKLKREITELKAKKAKKETVNNFFIELKTEAKTIYQKFITWLNT